MRKEDKKSKALREAIEQLPHLGDRIMSALWWSGIASPLNPRELTEREKYLKETWEKNGIRHVSPYGPLYYEKGLELAFNWFMLNQATTVDTSILMQQRGFGKSSLLELRKILGIGPIKQEMRFFCPCCGRKAPAGTVFHMPKKLP